MKKALSCQAVSVRYRSTEQDVLRDLNLQIEADEHVALLGLNGSGKTTLLSAITGLLPFRGVVEVYGISLTPSTLRAVREHIGFLFSVPDYQILFPRVLDDVAFTLERRGVPRDIARAHAVEALAALGIAELAYAAPHHLSHGQRQRVALAGVLVANPPLLLLDEPSALLDWPGKNDLISLLQGLAGTTVLMATHDILFAQQVCNRFLLLEEGGVVEVHHDSAKWKHLVNTWQAG